ncbi:glycerol-3-phosphate responsive antiterminator [bacterium]|nr:glycerol-3-phosphate responsive antiterminator [bacterium]
MNSYVNNIISELSGNPVIPCTNNFDDILDSNYNNIKVVLLYDLNIFDLISIAKKNLTAKKTIILNIDTVKGLLADEYGIKFLKEYIKVDMITSASPKSINCLKKLNFPVMQSMFILDTKSLKKGIELVKAGKPDLIDIRPGILYPKAAELLKKSFDIPVICSGFINNREELKKILNSGAIGITTSSHELWTLYS